MAYLGNCKVGDQFIVAHRNGSKAQHNPRITKIGRVYASASDGNRYFIEGGMRDEGKGMRSHWYGFENQQAVGQFYERIKLESKVFSQSRRLWSVPEEITNDELNTLLRIYERILGS